MVTNRLATADLVGDCGSCVGLCCVALPFARSAEFGHDKASGEPCHNLLDDNRCGIHDQLRPRGYSGCVTFDCFGAGQKVSQVILPGVDWRRTPARAVDLIPVFYVVRQLQEMLHHLAECAERLAVVEAPDDLREATDVLLSETDELTRRSPDELVALDVGGHRVPVGAVLDRVSTHLRSQVGVVGPDHRRADLSGARLAGADLRGADLRGALLLGTDLSGADLRIADLLGADLRGARLPGADLTDALFLTHPQVHSALGDDATRLPASVPRPARWSGTG